MKICVLNCSPRGKYSTTLQTSLYLQKRFADCEFEFVSVASVINLIEKDPQKAIDAMNAADLVVFSYPVYTFLAPSQLHRFVAVLKNGGFRFDGKFATQITTSKHFYDVTAHEYVKQNCLDFGFSFVDGLSADMEDLLNEKGREDAEKFFEYVLWCVENGIGQKREKLPTVRQNYVPLGKVVDEKSDKFDVVVVADLKNDNLKSMVDDFCNALKYKTRIVNLAEFKFKGGCIGCFNCTASGNCIYKDGFQDLLRNEILSADSIVYAFSVQDHSMGTTFKTFDDRQFCNGHRTVSEGKPFAYIADGDLENENNLVTVIKARAEVGHNFLAGIAIDAKSTQATVDKLEYALENHYVQPRNFYGVGGMKIFRDLIWVMRGLMKEDHKFYKKHGLYDDLPQKHRGKMTLMCLLGALIRNPKVKAKMGNMMNEGMILPYKKVLDKTEKRV